MKTLALSLLGILAASIVCYAEDPQAELREYLKQGSTPKGQQAATDRRRAEYARQQAEYERQRQAYELQRIRQQIEWQNREIQRLEGEEQRRRMRGK